MGHTDFSFLTLHWDLVLSLIWASQFSEAGFTAIATCVLIIGSTEYIWNGEFLHSEIYTTSRTSLAYFVFLPAGLISVVYKNIQGGEISVSKNHYMSVVRELGAAKRTADVCVVEV